MVKTRYFSQQKNKFKRINNNIIFLNGFNVVFYLFFKEIINCNYIALLNECKYVYNK